MNGYETRKVMRNYSAMRQWVLNKRKPDKSVDDYIFRRISGSLVLALKCRPSEQGFGIPVHSICIVQCYSDTTLKDLDKGIIAYITEQHNITFAVDPDYYVSMFSGTRMGKAIAKLLPVDIYVNNKRPYLSVNAKTYPIEEGITFNYFTWSCHTVIPLENRPPEPIPEVRRQWLRDLKKFKSMTKALCRLGVVEAELNRRIAVEEVTFGDLNLSNVLIEVVRTMLTGENVSPLLLRFMFMHQASGITYTSPLNYSPGDAAQIYDKIDAFMTVHSKRLREMYGVFGDEYKLVL